jgi:hypothetical protein
MMLTTTPLAPVWARQEMVFKPQTKSEEQLLKLYAEEMFIANHFSTEDDADAQQVNAASHDDSSCNRTNTAIERKSSTSVADPVLVPYLAQTTTLLFDIETLSDCQTLGSDCCCCSNVHEITVDRTATSQGYSLIPSTPVCSVGQLNKLHVSETQTISEQGEASKRQLEVLDSKGGSCNQEVGYNCELSRIANSDLLPGIEHLTNVEARSVFITYNSDIQVLQQATTEFIDDRRDGECACLDAKSNSFLNPGESFLLADNDTCLGLSVQYPTAESLLRLIDELISSESIVDPHHELQPIAESPCPGDFFDLDRSQHNNYIALDQLLKSCDEMSCTVCAQSVAAGEVSDISHGEVEELSTSQPLAIFSGYISELSVTLPSPLAYFDVNNRQLTAYTAFNQLLLHLDNEEPLPRIHRADDDFDEEDPCLLSDSILEIYELSFTDNIADAEVSSPYRNEFETFDFDFELSGAIHQPAFIAALVTSPRSIDSLHSYYYSRRRSSNIRSRFMGNMKLDGIPEMSSDEDMVPSSSCSDASIDFGDQRGFVQALPTRRTDFLDDEDSDNDSVMSQSPTSSSLFETTESLPTSSSLIVEIVSELFDDLIWHREPTLQLTLSATPIDAHSDSSSSSNTTPDTDILEAVEIEILGLLSYIFSRINEGQTDELQALGSDLQWALDAIADVYPSLGLITHLGATIQILLERITVFGSN